MERNKLDQALDLMKEWQNENPDARAVFATAIEQIDDKMVNHAGILVGKGELCVTNIALYLFHQPDSIKLMADALGSLAYSETVKNKKLTSTENPQV